MLNIEFYFASHCYVEYFKNKLTCANSCLCFSDTNVDKFIMYHINKLYSKYTKLLNVKFNQF